MKSKKPSGSNASRVTVELSRDEAIYVFQALAAHADMIEDSAARLAMEFDPRRQAKVLHNVSIRVRKAAGLPAKPDNAWPLAADNDDDIPF